MPRWWAIAIGLPLVSKLDPWSLTPSVRWVWLFGLVYAFAVLFVSRHPLEGSLDFFCLLLMFGVGIAAAERENLDQVMVGMVLGLGVSSVLVIPQHFGWSPVPQSAGPAGLFFNREVLAEVAAPLLVWSVVSRKLVLSLICIIPVALCDSRIAVLVSAVCIAYAFMPRKWWAYAIASVMMIGLGGGMLLLFGAGKIDSAGLRMVLWGAAYLDITTFGHGLGYWREAHPFPIEEFVHSDWLQFLVELGAGGIAFIALPILTLARGKGSIAERCALVAVTLEALVSFPLHGAAGAFIFAALAGNMARDRALVRDPGLSRRITARFGLRREASHAANVG